MSQGIKQIIEHLEAISFELVTMGYYVARGAKPLFIIGCFEFDSAEEMRGNKETVRTLIEGMGCSVDSDMEISSCAPIPCVIEGTNPDGKPVLHCAICSHKWVCEVYEWLCVGKVPTHLKDALMGMLCGYDSISIEKFVETRVRNPK